jgi:hypothetical protein
MVSLSISFTITSYSNVKPLYEGFVGKKWSRLDRQYNDVRRNMAEQFPGLTFQGSGSADVDYLLNFLSITNYTDDLLGGSAG